MSNAAHSSAVAEPFACLVRRQSVDWLFKKENKKTISVQGRRYKLHQREAERGERAVVPHRQCGHAIPLFSHALSLLTKCEACNYVHTFIFRLVLT